jgi:cytoskeletal protein CcmA (bactofilin family)
VRNLFRRLTRRRRSLDRLRFGVTFGPDVLLRGSLRGADSVRVCGRGEGNADVAAGFVLAENGSWQGNINATHVFIAGEVHGNVTAREHLEIAAGARIVGDLRSPVIAVAEGAVHEGEVRMAKRTRMIRFDERRQEKERDK